MARLVCPDQTEVTFETLLPSALGDHVLQSVAGSVFALDQVLHVAVDFISVQVDQESEALEDVATNGSQDTQTLGSAMEEDVFDAHVDQPSSSVDTVLDDEDVSQLFQSAVLVLVRGCFAHFCQMPDVSVETDVLVRGVFCEDQVVELEVLVAKDVVDSFVLLADTEVDSVVVEVLVEIARVEIVEEVLFDETELELEVDFDTLEEVEEPAEVVEDEELVTVVEADVDEVGIVLVNVDVGVLAVEILDSEALDVIVVVEDALPQTRTPKLAVGVTHANPVTAPTVVEVAVLDV